MTATRAAGIAMIAAGLVIAGATAVIYGPKLLDYKKGRDLYDSLEDSYTARPDKDGTGTAADEAGADEEKIEEETEAETDGILTAESRAASLIGELAGEGKADDYARISVDHAALLKENSDYIGWIYVPGTDISYPVVQSSDNADYLHTNFAGDYNYPGTIFNDCDSSTDDVHMILYGHNMRDGSMFASLNKYLEQDFLDEHPVFWFLSPEGDRLCTVFSAYGASPYDSELYSEYGSGYETDEEWQECLDAIEKASAVKVKEAALPEPLSQAVTLSTCTDDSSVRCAVTGAVAMVLKPQNAGSEPDL